jgi:hypothetical protein
LINLIIRFFKNLSQIKITTEMKGHNQLHFQISYSLSENRPENLITAPRVMDDITARSYSENRLEKGIENCKNLLSIPIWTEREEVTDTKYP